MIVRPPTDQHYRPTDIQGSLIANEGCPDETNAAFSVRRAL